MQQGQGEGGGGILYKRTGMLVVSFRGEGPQQELL